MTTPNAIAWVWWPQRLPWTLAVVAAVGCNGKAGDSAAAMLPPDSGGASDSQDSGGTFDGNSTTDTGFNLQPELMLGISHIGYWDQSPVGGPYTAMTGELLVEEMLDGRPDQPWCRVTYALTGLALDAHTCDLCDSAFLVEFFVVAEGQTDEELAEYGPLDVGGQAECFSPDLPADGERWEMGWSSIDETLYFNYYGSNIWLPWYAGLGDHDRVEFSWITSAGFHLPEEDD